ncbi:MAG: hypothetical protein WCK88_05875 [bacterium]
MDTKKDTSPVKKTSFWKKIIRFTLSDTDYQPEIYPEAKTTSLSSKKNLLSNLKNIKAAILVFGVFYLLLCAFILLNPQFALFFNNVFGIQYVTIRFVLEYTIYVVYSIFGILLGTAFLFFWYRSIVIKTRKRYKEIVLWILTIVF